MNLRKISITFVLIAIVAGNALAKDPPRDILGVTPGMSEADARAHLDKAGHKAGDERMKHDVWQIWDNKIVTVGVRFDAKTRVVRWVTAVAQPRSIRYSDVGDLKTAQYRTDGRNHTYIWKVSASGSRKGYVVEALGGDPEFLTSYRLLRVFE